MRNEGNNERIGRYSRKVRGEMLLCDIKDALEDGCNVTMLIRHAERPPLEPGDQIFGASLALTEREWRMARRFGVMKVALGAGASRQPRKNWGTSKR